MKFIGKKLMYYTERTYFRRRIPSGSARIGYRAKKEDVANLYRDRKVTLREASGLADVSLREMIELLMEHGIKGNITLKQQQKSMEYVERMLK